MSPPLPTPKKTNHSGAWSACFASPPTASATGFAVRSVLRTRLRRPFAPLAHNKKSPDTSLYRGSCLFAHAYRKRLTLYGFLPHMRSGLPKAAIDHIMTLRRCPPNPYVLYTLHTRVSSRAIHSAGASLPAAATFATTSDVVATSNEVRRGYPNTPKNIRVFTHTFCPCAYPAPVAVPPTLLVCDPLARVAVFFFQT